MLRGIVFWSVLVEMLVHNLKRKNKSLNMPSPLIQSYFFYVPGKCLDFQEFKIHTAFSWPSSSHRRTSSTSTVLR